MISSVYDDPEITTQSDLEFFLGSRVIHQVILERVASAYKYLKMAESISPEIETRNIDIIGTNDEDLKLAIEAELQHLQLQYAIKENYVFAEKSEKVDHYGSDENYINTETFELSVSVKYMFFLTSTSSKIYASPVIARTGVAFEPDSNFQWFDKAIKTGYPGDFLPNVFYDNDRANPKNLYYSTEVVDEEYLDVSEAMLASKDVLEIIALNYTNEVYYFLENRYKEKFENTKEESSQHNNQKSDKKGFSGLPALLIVFSVLILFFASIFGN
jgi:hypothetical protein